jgi:TRAP-type C4-dicarboxylate transport system permease small subunit
MKKRKNPIEFLLGVIAVSSFFGVAFAVLLQITTRGMENVSFVWTEELSRFFFILGITSAAPLAYKSGDFVYIEFLIDSPKNKSKRIMQIIVKVITLLVFSAIVYKGLFFISLGFDQHSAAMGIPMAIPYSFVVLSALLIVLNILSEFFRYLNEKFKLWK